ncbi:MAG: tetratricopeptide repeat protein [Bacillota bacterium]
MNKLYRGFVVLGFFWSAAALADTPPPLPGTKPAPMTASQAAAAKAANDEAQAENVWIMKASMAEGTQDWAGAEAALKQLITMNPARWDFSQSLGNDQFNEGKYADAVKSYDTAIQGASQDKKDPAAAQKAIAAMYTNQGNAYLKLNNKAAATDAFSKSAATGGDSGGSALSFYNLCATAYNAGKTREALADCDKAIAIDPTMADAYFVKGTILVNEGETDAKGNFNVPPGTWEALKTYLKLEPHGKHAAEAKSMLQLE